MKKSYWKPLFLLATFGFCSISLAQGDELKIKQDSKLDSILFQKIALDRERYGNEYYTLQLYYGNLEVAEQLMEKAIEIFPHIPMDLSFETPNYKVQAGKFKDKIIGLKTLDTLKKSFPSAFLLTRKN